VSGYVPGLILRHDASSIGVSLDFHRSLHTADLAVPCVDATVDDRDPHSSAVAYYRVKDPIRSVIAIPQISCLEGRNDAIAYGWR